MCHSRNHHFTGEYRLTVETVATTVFSVLHQVQIILLFLFCIYYLYPRTTNNKRFRAITDCNLIIMFLYQRIVLARSWNQYQELRTSNQRALSNAFSSFMNSASLTVSAVKEAAKEHRQHSLHCRRDLKSPIQRTLQRVRGGSVWWRLPASYLYIHLTGAPGAATELLEPRTAGPVKCCDM